MAELEKASTIFDLSLDIKYVVLDNLDNRSLAYLAQTCKYFGMLVRNIISFRKAEVSTIDHAMPKMPPFLNYRAGVAIGSKFYMPFINENPFCYEFDLTTGVWTSHKLNLIDMKDFQPQITSAAVIGTKIYLVGGRLLKSYTLSNGLIEIDIANFNARFINNANGMPPRPRHEHSVDAIDNRYLVVFGGLCYNSVGENDVFVYDIIDNRWFIPPISGHVPHLRFGHATAVIGDTLYIHGGAQLESGSNYTIYDDLYKLDCKTWVWYKYEHPEVEKYLRNQIPTPGQSTQRNHLISTTGDSPYDRFQSYMCSFGNKLIVFGGHSIREDEYENEILCSYPIDEICVFNTKRRAWTTIHATIIQRNSTYDDSEEESITVSDMSVATTLMGSRGIRIHIFAGRKAAEVPRSNLHDRSSIDSSTKSKSLSSSSNGSGHSVAQDSSFQRNNVYSLPIITESVTPERSHSDEPVNGDTERVNGFVDSNENVQVLASSQDRDDGVSANDHGESNSGEVLGTDSKSNSEKTEQGEVRTPNETSHSDIVKQLFQTEPDLDDSTIPEEDGDYLLTRSSSGSTFKGKYRATSKRRRPSISIIHRETGEEGSSGAKNTSSSSHSSISSNGSSFGDRKTTYDRKVIPCTIIIDLIE